ncbi:MAG TPA: DUF2934 domain-containing protein [Rhodopila sp.]|uniref:DUF2934 domain-containing protein n=1 Tax=Rhodopila sp. TaxID=2480087 RepID=UPI002C8503DA|nr:DUF2934 domain-containing protein [Rhodopila sp.]HVY16517.1 DUF2934 domain-containing protein [Rhodopila sp.]
MPGPSSRKPAGNPLVDDPEREQRVRERAYHLWEAEGKPHGRDVEFWERARELVAIEESATAGRLPNPATRPEAGVEDASIQENLGEFPDRFTDQGDVRPTPAPKRKARARTKKAG